jgi:serine O-acetyltransferase
VHLITRIQRKSFKLYAMNIPLLPAFIWKLKRIIFSCDIKYTIELGSGTTFFHNALGVAIHPKAKIGKNCPIYQNVTIGGNRNKRNGEQTAPIIGNDVFIGPGSCILGPIKIGNGAVIGANSEVTKDVHLNEVALNNAIKNMK